MFDSFDDIDTNDAPLPAREDIELEAIPIAIARHTDTDEVNPWSPFAYHELGWRRYKPKEPKALFGSVLVHALVIGSFFVSFNEVKKIIPPKNEVNTFTVSLNKGDDLELRMPVASIEAEKDQEEIKEVEEPAEEPLPISKSNMPAEQVKPPEPQEASSTQGEAADNPTPAMNEGGGDMIWTPPAPGSTPSGAKGNEGSGEEVRVSLPTVEMPTGASDAVLLSYDQARYSDAVAMREVARISNTGMIMMAVGVDETGTVTSCVVTSTSGSVPLDERACALVASYKYRPAQDAKGKPYASIVSEVLEWAKDGKFSEPQSPEEALQKLRNIDPKNIGNNRRPLPTVKMNGRNGN